MVCRITLLPLGMISSISLNLVSTRPPAYLTFLDLAFSVYTHTYPAPALADWVSVMLRPLPLVRIADAAAAAGLPSTATARHLRELGLHCRLRPALQQLVDQ